MKNAQVVTSFVIVINLMAWLFADAGIEPMVTSSALDIDNLLNTFNTTRAVENWTSWAHGIPWAGDIVAGLMFIINAVGAIVKVGVIITAGLPLMLMQWGAPLQWSTVITVLWAFSWFFYAMDVVTGRRTMGDD